MATFKFTGAVTVTGGSIETEQDAIDALQEMLDSYEEMDCYGSAVVIHWDKVEKV